MKIIYYIFIGFLVLTALLLIVSALPVTGNIRFMVVQSGSMEPAIKMGSVVMVRPTEDYNVGDIITFQRRGEANSTTHRIVDIRVVGGESVYTTQGDANNAPDLREFRKSEVMGKTLFSIPYFGYLVVFAQKPIGFVLIIVVPAAIIVGDEIRKIIKEIKRNPS